MTHTFFSPRRLSTVEAEEILRHLRKQRGKQKYQSDLGLRGDHFKGKQRNEGLVTRKRLRYCVLLFLSAPWPLCLFASLGRWKLSFYAVAVFYSGPTPSQQMMKIPSEGRVRQTLKDNRSVRGGCESFFPFSAEHLVKDVSSEINAGGFLFSLLFTSFPFSH